MSFYVYCEIVCVDCATTIAGRTTKGPVPRREMKAEARKAGWSFDDMGDARCRGCTKSHTEDQKELST